MGVISRVCKQKKIFKCAYLQAVSKITVSIWEVRLQL